MYRPDIDQTLDRGSIPSMELMHAGGAVADLDSGIERFNALGASGWVRSAFQDSYTYDHAVHQVVAHRVRIAFGSQPGGLLYELVAPDEQTPASPHWRYVAAQSGLNHLAYWCGDVPSTARRLMNYGAELEMIPLGAGTSWAEPFERGGVQALIGSAPVVFVRMPDGPLIELVDPVASRPALRAFCGEDADRLIPEPSGYPS